MKTGTEVLFSSYGFNTNGDPNKMELTELIEFDQFLTTRGGKVKLLGSDKNGVIKVVDASNCKIIDKTVDLSKLPPDQAILG